MAFDQSTRNRLQRLVSDARALLTQEFTRQVQHQYGMDPATGEVADVDKLSHVDDTRRETARLLRDTLNHYLATSPSGGNKATLERIVREQAFTVLNRLAALRMMEARGLLIESVARGYQSKGFQLYQHLAASALGETGDAYRCYLFSLFDEFALDLAVLFDRFSPQGRLFPRESALLGLLDIINHSDIEPLWAEDETIGWIYQYFNSQEERRQMRAASSVPRNSRELAVRNQFFTPRYVVEFLTDNTLGRIWYEMTQGRTALKDQCRYLVRRPNEIFLGPGEEAPQQEEPQKELSQEELLQQPVYIPFRALKDPRDITMLDPACGSMHFGLYAFDLYEKMYDEAWELESQISAASFARTQGLKPLRDTYTAKEDFLRDMPRLIIEHNIHGLDIDPRAVQIASLSLWLRAQKSWQLQDVKPQQRPQIQRANIVCAEPMPGERELLKEFTTKLQPRVLGQLVERIFDKMQLAGEAGSLLKIEEEIQDAVEQAREEFNREILRRREAEGYLIPEVAPERAPTLFDFADLPDRTSFWNQAEQEILDALRAYAVQAEGPQATQKRIFAQDAVKGFAFIDICRRRYDFIVMNPPFGEATGSTYAYLSANYPSWSDNLACASLIRSVGLLNQYGLVGAFCDRTVSIKSSYEDFRKEQLIGRILSNCDTGWGVLDANVETTAFILQSEITNPVSAFFDISTLTPDQQSRYLYECVCCLAKGAFSSGVYLYRSHGFRRLPNTVIGYYFPNFVVASFNRWNCLKDEGFQARQGHSVVKDQHSRVFWELPLNASIGKNREYTTMYNGGEFSMFYLPIREVTRYGENALYLSSNSSVALRNQKSQFLNGIGYGKRGDILDAHIVPEDSIFTDEGQAITGINRDGVWFVLAYINSSVAQFMVNQFCGQHKHCGYVNLLPLPDIGDNQRNAARNVAQRIIALKRTWSSFDETCREYHGPAVLSQLSDHQGKGLRECIENFCNIYGRDAHVLTTLYEQNDTVFRNATISDEGERAILRQFETERPPDFLWKELADSIKSNTYESFLAADILSWILGCVFGNWDFRKGRHRETVQGVNTVLNPLPRFTLVTLLGADGLPTNETPADYPIRISWDGILVDDPVHRDDVAYRVRKVLELIWDERAEAIEQELCEVLGVMELRDYFAKPNHFFAEHLKRYTKSRRQGPIYWPLQTALGSYTLWLYYHRLNDQTLYTCINSFVEPKLKAVAEQINTLHIKAGRSKQEYKELERLLDFEQELKDLRDELLRVAGFWKPDLNDGVQITAAPLWKLFQHKPWQKTLKDTWDKLENGDYDWAHLAYSIWPDRVREKCKHDKALAIAHGLEDLYEAPPEQPRKKRGRTRG